MFKKLLLIIVLVIAAGVFYFYTNLDSLIKNAIQKYGSAATQTQVELGGVHVSLTSGEGSLKDLSVGVPEGFKSARSFFLGEIKVKVDTKSARGNGPIIINEIIIDKPEITYEILNGKNNLQAIANNARAYAASPESKKSSVNKAATGEKKEVRKFIIDKLIIRDSKVTFNQEMVKDQNIYTELPDITMSNIGRSTNGATPAEITQQIMQTLTTQATVAATAQLTGQLLENIKSGGDIKENIGGALKGLFGK